MVEGIYTLSTLQPCYSYFTDNATDLEKVNGLLEAIAAKSLESLVFISISPDSRSSFLATLSNFVFFKLLLFPSLTHRHLNPQVSLAKFYSQYISVVPQPFT